METYFSINDFEDGWRSEEFIYDEVIFEYCTEALDIPEDKIESVSYNNNSIELILHDLDNEDINDDWYVNLHKICA